MEQITNNEIFSKLVELNMTILMIVAIVLFLIYILQIIARWKIFKKMGESGWKSIIPIYNTIILYDCIWSTAIFWFKVFISFLSIIAMGIIELFKEGLLDKSSSLFGLIYTGCSYYLIGAGILVAVLTFIYTYKFSKAFGHGFLFSLGLLLCPRVFEMIIAFGKSEYKGVQ